MQVNPDVNPDYTPSLLFSQTNSLSRPFSAGAAIGNVMCGKTLDYNYKRVARQIGVSVDHRRGNDLRHFSIEKARLEVIWYPLILGSCTVIAWGWSLQARTSLAAPLIVLFFAGFFLSGAMAMLSALLVDLYPQNPATATALDLTRCLVSAAGTAVIQYIIDAMGVGWCYTFLGLLTMAFSPLLGKPIIKHWNAVTIRDMMQRVSATSFSMMINMTLRGFGNRNWRVFASPALSPQDVSLLVKRSVCGQSIQSHDAGNSKTRTCSIPPTV